MGMTIDEAIKIVGTMHYPTNGDNEKERDTAIMLLLDTAKKYQEFQDQSLSLYMERLKADMVAMLTELQLEIEEKEQYYQEKFLTSRSDVHATAMGGRMFGCGECKEVIQQKINALRGNTE